MSGGRRTEARGGRRTGGDKSAGGPGGLVTAMLHEYKESTRKARAAKWAELDAWWGEERRRRAVRARGG